MNKCYYCKFYYTVGEWSDKHCKIADKKNDDCLMILGENGNCPYY